MTLPSNAPHLPPDVLKDSAGFLKKYHINISGDKLHNLIMLSKVRFYKDKMFFDCAVSEPSGTEFVSGDLIYTGSYPNEKFYVITEAYAVRSGQIMHHFELTLKLVGEEVRIP